MCVYVKYIQLWAKLVVQDRAQDKAGPRPPTLSLTRLNTFRDVYQFIYNPIPYISDGGSLAIPFQDSSPFTLQSINECVFIYIYVCVYVVYV